MSTSTLAQEPHYRRTKSGQWVVQGPASIIKPGARITVHKKDGTVKTETIATVGKAFQQDGIQVCYGYIAEREARPARHTHRSVPRCERCRSCGGDGSVEAELGTCESCGADYDC